VVAVRRFNPDMLLVSQTSSSLATTSMSDARSRSGETGGPSSAVETHQT
jgi:hypothetical protein